MAALYILSVCRSSVSLPGGGSDQEAELDNFGYMLLVHLHASSDSMQAAGLLSLFQHHGVSEKCSSANWARLQTGVAIAGVQKRINFSTRICTCILYTGSSLSHECTIE